MTRTITITSGKGGVGKTSLSVNLALELGRLGKRVCLFDADLGLANIDIVLGLETHASLEDVVDGRYSIQEILVRDHHGIDIVPGSTGVEKMARLKPIQVAPLAREFATLDDYDIFLFDASSGISRNVAAFCLASDEVVVVVTPEPTSLTDAYGLLKVLCMNGYDGEIKVLVNQCKDVPSARQAYGMLREIAQGYLTLDMPLLGVVQKDPKVPEAVRLQKPFTTEFSDCNAAKCVRTTAQQLLRHTPRSRLEFGMESFWTKCFGYMCGPITLSEFDDEPEPSLAPAEKPVATKEAEDTAAAAEKQAVLPLVNRLMEMVGSLAEEVRDLGGVLEKDRGRQRVDGTRPPEQVSETAATSRDSSVPELIRDAVSFALVGTGIRCTMAVSEGVWNSRNEPVRLRQLVSSLIMDVARAMRVSGRMQVRSDNLKVVGETGLPLEAPGNYGHIVVESEGVERDRLSLHGLAALDATVVPNVAGLGPVTCYPLDDDTGGCVLMENTVGESVRFHLLYSAEIPAEAADSLEAAIWQPAYTTVRERRAMPEETADRLALLRSFRYQVEHTGEGEEELDLYKVDRPSKPPIFCAFNGPDDDDDEGETPPRQTPPVNPQMRTP